MDLKIFKRDLFIFLSFWFISGLFSVLVMKVPYYDWYNYHHYNSWAYFNNRYDTDFLAANFRSYFIPYVDLLQYLLLDKLNAHPILFLFIESIDTALVLLLTFKIGDILLYPEKRQKLFLNFYNILFVSCSPIFVLLTNFSMADLKVAFFTLLAFYIFIKNIFNSECHAKFRNIFISGFVLGISLSMKLTSVIYVLTFPLVMLLMFKRIKNPFKTFGLFILGVITSFVTITGHWYYTMYKHYGNPFLPYFNNIFKSDYTLPINFVNEDFAHVKPRDLIEFVFFPFLKSVTHTFGNSERSFDPRFAIIFVSTLLILPYLIFIDKSKKQTIFCDIISVNNLWLLLYYVAISYYLNIFIFATYRYTIASEVLFGFYLIILAYAVFERFKNKFIYIVCFLCAAFAFTASFTDFGNSNYKIYPNFLSVNKVIKVNDAKFENGAYVFVFSTVSSYIFPYQNPNVHYRLIIVPDGVLYPNRYLYRKKDLMINNAFLNSEYMKNSTKDIIVSKKRIYFVFLDDPNNKDFFERALRYYYPNSNRKVMNCRILKPSTFGKCGRIVNVCEYNKEGAI